MPMATVPQEPPRPLRRVPPIRSIDQYPLPVGQNVVVLVRSPEEVPSAARAALGASGFTVVQTSGTSMSGNAAPESRPPVLFAERSVRRVETHISMRMSVGVLVGAGVSLGAVDGLILGKAIYAFPWIGVGLIGAGILWWRYGRSFESEVVALHCSPLPQDRSSSTEGSGAAPRMNAAWSAGRVRSVLFAGSRTAVGVVDCPIPLMEDLSKVVRTFEGELGASPPQVRSPTDPEASTR